MDEDETPVAWQAMPQHAAVVAADGSEIGTTEKLLAEPEDDIFHGIVVRRGDGEAIELPAQRIKKITAKRVITDLGADEAASLPAYRGR